MSEHSTVQTEEKVGYTMTETRKEHRSSAFASSKQTSEELRVQFELLQESTTEYSATLQHVEQRELLRMTTFYVGNLLLEEENKCFEMDKSLRFVHEQKFALQDDRNEEAMYQKLCYLAMKHDKPMQCQK